MRKFRAHRARQEQFYFASVWLCGSYAAKCGKANNSSRKCRAGEKYFLSEDLARAAELQVHGLDSLPCALGQNPEGKQQVLGS